MSETHATVSRRSFCAGACGVTAAAALATLFSSCGSKDSSSSPSGPSSTPVDLAVLNGAFSGGGVDVTPAGSPLNDVGGAALVQSIAGNFLVSRTSATVFTAIDATCTHEGCTVNGADGSVYVCPCHGSRYSRSGQVILGPATASLRQYGATFAGGVVTIKL
ncbi:MAG TPA: Rieske (2Fe-2S) protein [Vicinamibacterales bacterium]|nr:Rieske (2Fe-2S) protein [Vicinamibacterales bacterium]